MTSRPKQWMGESLADQTIRDFVLCGWVTQQYVYTFTYSPLLLAPQPKDGQTTLWIHPPPPIHPYMMMPACRGTPLPDGLSSLSLYSITMNKFIDNEAELLSLKKNSIPVENQKFGVIITDFIYILAVLTLFPSFFWDFFLINRLILSLSNYF